MFMYRPPFRFGVKMGRPDIMILTKSDIISEMISIALLVSSQLAKSRAHSYPPPVRDSRCFLLCCRWRRAVLPCGHCAYSFHPPVHGLLYNSCYIGLHGLSVRSLRRHYSSNINVNKKLIRRWDSERELSLQHRARTTKYNRLVHKFRHRSTRLCVWTHVYACVYQIQWNNAI